jgi:hypothetical protein
MTLPRTTLVGGQSAPMTHRSSAAPPSTLPDLLPPCFFGAICGTGPITTLSRLSADYSADTPPRVALSLDLGWSLLASRGLASNSNAGPFENCGSSGSCPPRKLLAAQPDLVRARCAGVLGARGGLLADGGQAVTMTSFASAIREMCYPVQISYDFRGRRSSHIGVRGANLRHEPAARNRHLGRVL